MGDDARFRLARGVYLRWDRHAAGMMLLGPERGLLLDAIAADVVALCDGERTLGEVCALLAERFAGADRARIARDVGALVDALLVRRLVERSPTAVASSSRSGGGALERDER